MFPVSDFNFVVAGIATFAATVGYACTRQLGATLYDLLFSQIRLMQMINDVRSGPISPHDASLEHVQETASGAKPSSSNLDDTTSQDQDITSSTTLSNPETLKRKNPDGGFDEDNVRRFFFSDVAFR